MRKITNFQFSTNTDAEKKAMEFAKAFEKSLPKKFKHLSFADIQLLKPEDKLEYYTLRQKHFGKPSIWPPINPEIKVAIETMERSINVLIGNLCKKIDSLPVKERFKFCQGEFRKFSTMRMEARVSVNFDPERKKDIEAIYDFLKETKEDLRHEIFEDSESSNLPDVEQPFKKEPVVKSSSIQKWKDLVRKDKELWFQYIKNKFVNNLKTKVARAAFADQAYCLGWIINQKTNRKIKVDFCESYFGGNFKSVFNTSSAADKKKGKDKEKDLFTNTEKVKWIFKEKLPFDGVVQIVRRT